MSDVPIFATIIASFGRGIMFIPFKKHGGVFAIVASHV